MIAEVRMKQAVAALGAYRHREDLNGWLKNYMKGFPSMGSRDRRELRDLLYGAIRMGRLFPQATPVQQIGMGQVFANGLESEFVRYALTRSGWDLPALPEPGLDAMGICRAWALVGFTFRETDWFPAHDRISSAIDLHALLNGFLMPPRTWVRLRTGREGAVENELNSSGWIWGNSAKSPNARWVESGRALDGLNAHQNGFFEVQDLASQRTIRFMNPISGESWWDACAGSGGKSLLLHDREPGIKLFATDERQSTLHQLHERFSRAGIRSYSRYCVDIEERDPLERAGSFPRQFDAVLADVPCSGSGTWSASPDWLFRFEREKITAYSERQFRLVGNLLPYVREGGRLVYLTCSLYADENENVVDRLCAHYGWQCLEQGYEQASSEGGDVMFGAVLVRR